MSYFKDTLLSLIPEFREEITQIEIKDPSKECIYSLDTLLNEYERYAHVFKMEIFCAYVLHRFKREEIQAALECKTDITIPECEFHKSLPPLPFSMTRTPVKYNSFHFTGSEEVFNFVPMRVDHIKEALFNEIRYALYIDSKFKCMKSVQPILDILDIYNHFAHKVPMKNISSYRYALTYLDNNTRDLLQIEKMIKSVSSP